MSEEFVRCPECGNLNIKGTSKCVFCDADISDAEVVTHEVEAPPEIEETSPAPPTDIPTPSDQEEEEEMTSPKLPDFEKFDKPDEKGRSAKDISITDVVDKKHGFVSQIFFISLFTIIVSIVHYSLNFLTAIASLEFTYDSFDIIPLPANLLDVLHIRGVSFFLSIPFAILIGYVLGKIVRKYTTTRKSTIIWTSFAYILDIALNVVYAVVLVIITRAVVDEKAILFSWATGAVFIFIITIVITLFIPMISGSFLIFKNIDKVFFRDKYID